MKKTKLFIAVGMAVALGAGLTACGDPYSGEGTVVSKQIDEKKKTSGSSSSKSKKTRTTVEYEITVDVPDSDANRIFDVPKTQYDSIRVGEFVQIEEGKIR